MIFAQPLELTDGVLLLLVVTHIAALFIGVIFGRADRNAEHAAERDITGGFMTPPERDSDWPGNHITRVHDKPRRLRALSGGKP